MPGVEREKQGMLKGFFRLLVGIFEVVLAVLLSMQIAPGTMITVVLIGVTGFFVVLVILIMAGAMVVSSRNQAEALVRISEQALESQVGQPGKPGGFGPVLRGRWPST
ncbi:MAG TPA: hypothetical protein VH186_09815 [Chloroflexia bacterium]|nr:hypothetical protein [Chloroflexia bacterium]